MFPTFYVWIKDKNLYSPHFKTHRAILDILAVAQEGYDSTPRLKQLIHCIFSTINGSNPIICCPVVHNQLTARNTTEEQARYPQHEWTSDSYMKNLRAAFLKPPEEDETGVIKVWSNIINSGDPEKALRLLNFATLQPDISPTYTEWKAKQNMKAVLIAGTVDIHDNYDKPVKTRSHYHYEDFVNNEWEGRLKNPELEHQAQRYEVFIEFFAF